MDIVSNLPFVFKVNGTLCHLFSTDERTVYSGEFPSIKVVENEEIRILFDSSDVKARLYLDALDILPEWNKAQVDEDGRLYCPVSNTPFYLYKNDGCYDALRVDIFLLCVICGGQKYYSLFEVVPKQLSSAEWSMMRDDLEREIRGLAQDMVRCNIGFGNGHEGCIPPKKLYTFLVMQRYSPKVLASFIAIQNAPKFHIVTDYIEKSTSNTVRMDNVTIRRYLNRGGSDSQYCVPIKRVTYDIQENRLLKRIVSFYDFELIQFIASIEEAIEYRKLCYKRDNSQYQKVYIQRLSDFLDTAKKLREVTSIIKSQEWYQTISPLQDGAIPHAFALDSHYGVFYKMYEALKHPDFKVQMDPNYSYSWKKSSALYEMWCFVRLCRVFSTKYNFIGNSWDIYSESGSLFPYLENGTKMVFEDDKVHIEVIYDQFVPSDASKTKLHTHPFYIVGNHRRPDITIDVYMKEDDCYIGSIILECKYRKLTSFWYDSASWSSKPQIKAYYTDAKSNLFYGKIGEWFDLDERPVRSVIVLTPDLHGDGKEDAGINTLVKTLKPDANSHLISNLMDTVDDFISAIYEKYRKLKSCYPRA